MQCSTAVQCSAVLQCSAVQYCSALQVTRSTFPVETPEEATTVSKRTFSRLMRQKTKELPNENFGQTSDNICWQLLASSPMERIKLLFDHEERTVGTVSRVSDSYGVETEEYHRAFLFNFRVTGYISGPKFVGYR